VSEPVVDEATPARFELALAGLQSCRDGRYDESLLSLAIEGSPAAAIWQAERGLVVPRTYRRHDAFDAVCERYAARGWPVTVRQTGGGVVPQGPGIVNLSLAYRVQGPPMQHSEAGYRLICRLLADALEAIGVDAFPAAVAGSFCDGRYNLAVRRGDSTAKIAGTAQMWRRVPGAGDTHVGLVHALVLVDIDTPALTDVANAFEAAVGSARRYLPQCVVSARELRGANHDLTGAFVAALERALGAPSG
jgi:lipoate-protein ligase A